MMDEEVDDAFYSSSVTTSPKKTPELRLTSEIDTENYMGPESVVDPLLETETITYKPLEYHWFYTKYVTDKLTWHPLSYKDSAKLESTYSNNTEEIKQIRKQPENERVKSPKLNNYIISIRGGRFEVNLIDLEKRPVYWKEDKVSKVRRCLWFYKESNDQRFLPYEEEYSEFLELEYEKTIKKNTFHKRIDYSSRSNVEGSKTIMKQSSVSNEEAFVFHSTTIMLHYTQATMLDEFGNLNSDAQRPRVVKRGLLEVVDKVEADEIEEIDHLCFVVHGIGEACDLKFRPIVECVDDFRYIGSYITEAHLKSHIESKQINGRVEFLPISWHHDLHGEQTGIDERLKPLSLPSIPKLREFSNSTILDVLFYTSPIYCQTVINKVGNELNRLAKIFLERNPKFNGKISLIGHSLGSLICFDILSNQFGADDLNKDKTNSTESKEAEDLTDIDLMETINDFLERLNLTDYQNVFMKEKINMNNLPLLTENDLIQMEIPIGSRRLILSEANKLNFKKQKAEITNKIKSNLSTLPSSDNLKNGLAGTGQIMVRYPQLDFKVGKFFALGSPIPIFQTVRGIEKIETDFEFPTCDEFYNIFHPFDPVAYRFEPLVCPSPILKPVLMPHHKGRKRMHIELREGLSKVSEDVVKAGGDFLKTAWSTINDTQAFFKKLPMSNTTNTIEGPKSKTESNQLSEKDEGSNKARKVEIDAVKTERVETEEEKREKINESLCNFGKINKGKRIDYVLQESPFESFNEYIFAVASHACYWESEDTLLLIIKLLYGCEDIMDANVEINMTETQPQPTSWLTQVAAQTLSNNVQKTFSYFQQMGTLTSVLPSTSNSSK